MLISVTRFYVGSGLRAEILLNTDYIQRIEHYGDDHTNIKTKVMFDSLSCNSDRPDIMYLEDSLLLIKQKLGLAQNNKTRKNGTKRTPK